MASAGPYAACFLASESSQSTEELLSIEGLSFTLEPNTRYKFKYLIYFEAKHGIVFGMKGPLRPTFSGYKIETPLLSEASALRFVQNYNEVSTLVVDGTEGLVEISGVFRTGTAGGTLMPQYASAIEGEVVTIKASSKGTLHDQGS